MDVTDTETRPLARPTDRRLSKLVAQTFPFYLVVDVAGRVQAAGPSLRKTCPGLDQGAPVADHLQVLSPPGGALRLDRADGLVGRLVLLSGRDGALTLRGQVTTDGDTLVFVGSPWVTAPDQLGPLGLTLADFALHDPVPDFLMLLQAQTAALVDAERLADRLETAAADAARLTEMGRRLAADLDAIPDLVARLDHDGRLLEVRPGRDSQLPAPAADLVGVDAQVLLPGAGAQLSQTLQKALDTGATQAITVEHQRDGRTVHFEARLSPSGRDEVVLLLRDVTERRSLEDSLTRQAYTDSLTGLPNRALLTERIDAAVGEPSPDATDEDHAVLLLVDLDDFKEVNDTLGHSAGDLLLQLVGQRLAGAVRAVDTVARLGGDEFAVLLGTGGAARGVRLAARLLDSLGAPVELAGRSVRPRASIGVAVAERGLDAETLLRNADLAMYAAKRSGRHRFAAYHPSLHERLLDRLALEADLRGALDYAPDDGPHGRLEVHYQPVVDLEDGSVTTLEALARWQHPQHGSVPPSVFIPLAEDTGVIGPLGRWVLRTACTRAAGWLPDPRSGRPPAVAVNLSPRQLGDDALAADVRAALADAALPAERLVLELTESTLLDDPEKLTDRLRTLRATGVRLALDDFGTGYSSLGRLRNLPIDVLKLDRVFVTDLGNRAADAVARAVTDLGRALDLTVVAEGVESAAQVEMLRELGCHLGQGYHLGRPAASPQGVGP